MPVFGFQSEVYYMVDILLTDLTAQQSSATARRDSNKTTLLIIRAFNWNLTINFEEFWMVGKSF